jgi:hypothetical protein
MSLQIIEHNNDKILERASRWRLIAPYQQCAQPPVSVPWFLWPTRSTDPLPLFVPSETGIFGC